MNEQQKEIRRQRAKAWNAAHPERVRELARQWRDRNRAKLSKEAKVSYAQDPEKFKAAQRRFNERKPWYFAWIGARQRGGS